MLRIKTALPVLLSGAVLSAGAFAAPSVYPTGVTRYDPNKAFNQYVIFSGADKQTLTVSAGFGDIDVYASSTPTITTTSVITVMGTTKLIMAAEKVPSASCCWVARMR